MWSILFISKRNKWKDKCTSKKNIPKEESMKLKPQIYLDDTCFNINSMPLKIFDFKSVYDVELNYK